MAGSFEKESGTSIAAQNRRGLKDGLILLSLPALSVSESGPPVPQIQTWTGGNPVVLVDNDQFPFLIALLNVFHCINLLGD
jgi:hypothetical protein